MHSMYLTGFSLHGIAGCLLDLISLLSWALSARFMPRATSLDIVPRLNVVSSLSQIPNSSLELILT